MLLVGLKNNDANICKVVMTGVLRAAKGSLYSGLNNFSEYGVLDMNFSEDFGFTESEINRLLEENILGDKTERDDQKKAIKRWYNGYNIGGCLIYNPWSIMSCLDGCRTTLTPLKPYWVNTGNTKPLEIAFSNLDGIDEVNHLISTGILEYEIDPYIDLKAISTDKSAFFSMMLYSGYLTLIDKTQFKIPNREIIDTFYKKVLKIWITNRFKTEFKLDDLVNGLVECIENKEKYKSLIQEEILNKIDFGSKTESDFQSLLGGVSLLAIVTNKKFKHTIHSEVQNIFRKRIDNLFIPVQGKSVCAIIHEYKKSESSNTLEEVLEDALWQIYCNHYMSRIINLYKKHEHNNHWKFIINRAVVFYKDEINQKWSIEIHEFVHTIDQAESVNAEFSEKNGKLLKIHSELISGTKESKKAARLLFLRKREVKNIYKLLEKYSGDKATNHKRLRESSLINSYSSEDTTSKFPKISSENEVIIREKRDPEDSN